MGCRELYGGVHTNTDTDTDVIGFQTQCAGVCASVSNGVFTLLDTDMDTNTITDKMGLQPNCICVGVCVRWYEHFHTILYNPFLSVSVSGSVNTPLL